MPFAPLPESLTELCRSGAGCGLRAVELGCGDGQLLRLLRDRNLWCAGLDRMPRAAGSAADVTGDALRPPLRAGSLDLVVAGNLLRHVLPSRPDLGFLRVWLDLVRPGGSVFLLEDEPTAGSAARNYRDLQSFLARLVPGSRGPLVSLATFRRALPADLAAAVTGCGVQRNTWPLDRAAVLAMLAGGCPAPEGEAARLMAAIEAGGLAAGRQWWCRLVAGPGNGSR